MAQMRSCVNQKEWPRLVSLAHGIKGSSGNIGAVFVKDAAHNIERFCRDIKTEDADITQLNRQLDAFEKQLNTVLSSIKKIVNDIMIADIADHREIPDKIDIPGITPIMSDLLNALDEADPEKIKTCADHIKKFNKGELMRQVITKISEYEYEDAIEALIQAKDKTAQLQEMFNATVGGMALMAETRDPYTAGHQHRVSQFACDIAIHMGLSKDQLESIRISGLLHDIGKIRVPVSLLNRPGKLLKAEWELIKMHPLVGYKILKNIPFPWPIADIVYQHHERIDGSGYPRGLTGKDILLEAKIMAVADVIEAISSHRPYRPALPIESALNEIKNQKGSLFDEAVVESFLSCADILSKEHPPVPTPINDDDLIEEEKKKSGKIFGDLSASKFNG